MAIDKPLYDRITNKWDELDEVYERIGNARKNIAAFFRPDLGVEYDENHDMLMLGGDIYDGSPPWVARTMSTGLQGNIVSKRIDWIMYLMGDRRLRGITELDQWTQDVKEHNTDVYQNSNFYDVQPQFTLDGVTTGSPVMFGEEDLATGRVMWIPQHYLTYRLFYDRFNESEGIIIKDTQWSAKKIFDRFAPGPSIEQRLQLAKEKFSLPLYTAIIRGQMDSRFTIWRAVFKRTDPIWEGKKQPLGGKLWISAFFEELGAGIIANKETPLELSGYYSKPYVVWDYDKKLWEAASRTPAWEAIYDAASQSQVFKNYLENLQQKTRPAMAILASMQGKANFSPEGEVIVEKNDWNFKPEPINNVGDIRLDRETMDLFDQKLSRHFHLEMFRQFTDMAANSTQQFRVLQIMEIAGERITQLLPMIETHERYLSQVDDRVIDIQRQAGNGPFAPEVLERVADIVSFYTGEETLGVDLQVQFIGTLRQAQQMQQKLKPIQFGVSVASEIGNALGDPDIARLMVKGYETVDEALQAVHFPEKLTVEKEEYEKSVAALAEARAQQAQFENAVEMAKASKDVSGPVDDKSVLGTLAGSAA